LHPWANRLSGFTYAAAGREVALDAGMKRLRVDGHGLPIHGVLAAYKGWQVREVGAQTLVAELDFGADPELLGAFPFPHRLTLEIEQTARHLSVATTLTPTSEEPVPVSFGFHPYLTLPGVPRERLVLRAPAMTRILTDDRGIPNGEREAVPARHGAIGDVELDDHFCHELTMRFVEGYTHLQLFTTPGRPVVAIEPMTAPTDALRSGDGLRLATAPFRAVFELDLVEAS
jgi:galactose mutarotase-like enzyme